MKNYLLILTVFCLLSFTSTNDCDFNQNLKLDQRLIQIKDSLSVDTLILYRHWIHTNGENGYAKIFYSQEGNYAKKTLEFNTDKLNLIETKWQPLNQSDSIFKFLSQNEPKIITESYPYKNDIIVTETHSGQHIIQVIVKKQIEFCDKISEVDISCNYDVPQKSLIHYLRDTSYFSPSTIISGNRTRNIIGPKFYIDGKPFYTSDPKENRRLKKEHKKFRRKNK